MMIAAAQAHAAIREPRAGAIPQGVAHVRANREDRGLGWWASVRHGESTVYLVGADRADAIRQARERVRDLGLRLVEVG